jgi:hypothetical protein
MYTKIPTAKAISFISNHIRETAHEFQDIPAEALVEALGIVMRNIVVVVIVIVVVVVGVVIFVVVVVVVVVVDDVVVFVVVVVVKYHITTFQTPRV